MSRRRAKEQKPQAVRQKAKKGQPIVIGQKAQATLREMLRNTHQYLGGVRDALNIPPDWITVQEDGMPVAFAPPKKEKPA